MKKKILSAMLALTMCVGLAACGSSAGSSSAASSTGAGTSSPAAAVSTADAASTPAVQEANSGAESTATQDEKIKATSDELAKIGDKELTIGYAAPTMNNAYWTAVENGVKAAIKDAGVKVKLVEVDGNNDQATMNDKISDAISSGLDAMLLCPSDNTGVLSEMDQLEKAKIPTIIFDTPVDSDYPLSQIASDNVYAGYAVGQDLAKKMDDGAKILIVHSPRASACIDRYNGFVKALDESGKKYEIVNELDGQGDQNTSMNLVSDALVADPDLTAIFAVNDPSAMGCVNAIQQTTADLKNKILVYGVDGNPDAKKMIEDGDMAGTGAQSPETLGYDSLMSALIHLGGGTLDKKVTVKTFLITKDNVAQYGTTDWQ